MDVVGTTTGDGFAISASAILTEVDFEACFLRKVEVIFRGGCSMVGAGIIAIWKGFGKIRL